MQVPVSNDLALAYSAAGGGAAASAADAAAYAYAQSKRHSVSAVVQSKFQSRA